VKRKLYKNLKANGKTCGFPTVDLGSLYVAKISKGIFDAVIYTQRLCCHVYTANELKLAKQAFHELRRFVFKEDEIFRTSKFVRQSLRVISITLRTAERGLRLQDHCETQ
jgi:hypothetical protein